MMIRCLLVAFTILFCSGFTYGEDLSVVDGDTIKIKDGGKWTYCRLYGIDAPELSQDFGIVSKMFLEHMLKTSDIKVLDIGTDLYSRRVVKVYCMTSPTNGIEVNQFMVSQGLAWWYVQYSPKNGGYKVAQDIAKSKKIGVWSTDNPTPPWEYRKQRKKK